MLVRLLDDCQLPNKFLDIDKLNTASVTVSLLDDKSVEMIEYDQKEKGQNNKNFQNQEYIFLTEFAFFHGLIDDLNQGLFDQMI